MNIDYSQREEFQARVRQAEENRRINEVTDDLEMKTEEQIAHILDSEHDLNNEREEL